MKTATKANSKTANGSTSESLAGGSRAPGSLRVHFSSATDEWPTPQWLFDKLNAKFGFTLDPCATPQNAKCSAFFTRSEDGLAQDWSDNMVFMNPPYGRAIGQWMKKTYEAPRMGATVVCLVPARTDTAWWHLYAMKGEYRLLRGRLRFEGAKHSAPFPSAIVLFCPPGQVLRTASILEMIELREPPPAQVQFARHSGSDFMAALRASRSCSPAPASSPGGCRNSP